MTLGAAAVKRFEAANPDYQVNITITANDAYKQKIAVAMLSGTLLVYKYFVAFSLMIKKNATLIEKLDEGAPFHPATRRIPL